MRLITHRNNHSIGMGCLFCGERFDLADLATDVYAEDGEHLGLMCDSCLRLGDQELSARLRDHAESHRAMADDLDDLAHEPIRRESTEGFIHIKTGTILPVTDDDRAEAKARDHWEAEALVWDLRQADVEPIDDDEGPF
jgi:hypothetical protein